MERAMHAAGAERVEDGSFGRAYLTPSRPLVHQGNLVWAAPGADAAALEAACDALLAGDDVVVLEDDATAAALAAAGFRLVPEWVMALEAPVAASAAREVPLEAVLPSIDRWLATDTPFGADPEVRAQLLDHHRAFGRAGADERVFGVVEGGEVVAWAKRWERDGVAQVEDVVVLPEHRGRGLGRAVVEAAAAGGAGLTFLVALEDDWPRELYVRLGFRRVGGIVVATRAR
jgi:ribosomal protein S18 acetylase RimI-like enzyme